MPAGMASFASASTLPLDLNKENVESKQSNHKDQDLDEKIGEIGSGGFNTPKFSSAYHTKVRGVVYFCGRKTFNEKAFFFFFKYQPNIFLWQESIF